MSYFSIRDVVRRLALLSLLLAVGQGSLSAEKIRLDPRSPITGSLAFPGLEYESFRVVEVDPATAAALVASGAGERIENADRILLNAEVIDTSGSEMKALRRLVGPFSGHRLHLVQFAGPIRQAWIDALEADGLQVVTYIPTNAYLVWGDANSLARLQARAQHPASALQWEGSWLDRWKVGPTVTNDKLGQKTASLLEVQLVADTEANAATFAALAAAGGQLLQEPTLEGAYLNFVVQLDPQNHSVLTARPEVISIHRYHEPNLKDESQAMILAGKVSGNGPAAGNYFTTLANWGFTQAQFDASNFVVDVSDSGVDNGTTSPNHFAFYRNGDKTQASRLAYRVTYGAAGADAGTGAGGHGQINCSILGGYVPDTSVTVGGNTTSTTTFPHADAQGFRYGLGIVPFVRMGNSVIFDPGFTAPNLSTVQSGAYAAGARISSNSWGTSFSTGTYSIYSQAMDARVRDAQTGTAGNQPMVIVFGAGNAGSSAGTVNAPGTGKNIICVGAAEGVRSHATAAGGLDAAGADGCMNNDTAANSFQDVAGYSSRGPCTDARIKPDLMAGGTHITGMTFVTAASTGNGTAAASFRADAVCGLPGNTNATGQLADFFPTQNAGAPPYNQAQKWWTTSSGTSHATPAVAGAAALVYQQFINNPAYLAAHRVPAGSAPPSPALVKGYLMNSVRYLTGTGANDRLPSNSQGMGHANLGMAFDGVSRIVRDQFSADRFTASGQTRTIVGSVADNTKPFRVTLAWTDVPGPTSGNAYVNNLDLSVTVGGSTYRGNVFAATGGLSATGGTADARNNVESVFLPAGVSGNFTVTISAANIAGRADATVGGNNQDFALVVYNAQPASAPIVGLGTPVVGGGGPLRPNDCASLIVPLANSGNLGVTAVSAVLTTNTAGLTVFQGASGYADLPAGGSSAENAVPFRVTTSSGIACGTLANFTLTVTYTGAGSPLVSNFSLPVGPDVSNYVFTASTGATIPAGGTLVAGSAQDDATVNVTAPFAFSVYSTNVTAGAVLRASTNGVLQLVATGGDVDAVNYVLPSSLLAATLPSLIPYWDDLDLTTSGGGIYTQTVGSAPHRQWVIEWRGKAFLQGSSSTLQTLNFAIVFAEGVSGFQFRYVQVADATGANGSSASVGVQPAGVSPLFTEYSFNGPNITSGLVLTAAFPACAPGSGPCVPGSAPSIDSAIPSSLVIVGTPYTHTFTATGSPASTFAMTAGTLPPGLTLSAAGVLSGTATSAGTGTFSGLTVTASNGNLPNATQNFSLSAVTRAANSTASFGLTGNDALPGADPNGDGLTNLMAYALGLSPIANAGLYDHGTIRNYGGTNYYSIRLQRSSVATDLTYIVEASDNLTGAWIELARSTAGIPMTASGGVVVSDTGGPPNYVTEVRDVVPVPPPLAQADRFIRLRVTSP